MTSNKLVQSYIDDNCSDSCSIDDWINEYTTDEFELYAKWIFYHFRLPALIRLRFLPIMDCFPLFCTYDNEIYRVINVSKTGAVVITSDFEHNTATKQVKLNECSKWSAYSDKVALIANIKTIT